MILCLQTALPWTGVALLSQDGSTILWEQEWPSDRNESSSVLPQIQTGLAACTATATDCTSIMTVVGPGSFTALRVGISIANTLAYVHQLPIIGVTTFAYLMAGAPTPGVGVISASLRECFVRTLSGEELLLPLQETLSIVQQYPWYGWTIPAHSTLLESGARTYHEQDASIGVRMQQILTTGDHHPSTSIIVPYYLKAPNITQRKTR